MTFARFFHLPVPPALNPSRVAAVGCVYVLLYLLLDWVSFIHPLPAFEVTPWNPPPGLTLALLLAFGLRFWPLAFATVWCGNVLVHGMAALSVETLLLTGITAGGYGLMAALLHRVGAADIRDRGALPRFLAVLAGTALLLGGLYLLVVSAFLPDSQRGFLYALVRFWVGDAIGVLVSAPLILVLLRPGDWKFLETREFTLQCLAVMLSLWVVFGLPWTDEFKYFYLLFLPLTWISLRHGLEGACLTLAMIQVGLIVSAQWLGYKGGTVQEMQFLMASLAITGLTLGVTSSARKVAESELKRALRLAAAGEMAAALAHELNQPLTAVANYARAGQLMLEAGRGGELSDVLDKVAAEARRAGAVVRRLRDFFKTGHTRRDPVPILPLVVETIGEVEERAKRQACRLEYAIPADLPPARGDGVQLQVVLRNLLINALDAVSPESFGRSTDEPVVSLAAHREGNELQLVVQDNGPGILPQFRERLFEPFATSKPPGMGLGLAIRGAIIEAHGGRLWAESPSAGGSRFTIALPLHHSVYSVKPLPVKGAP